MPTEGVAAGPGQGAAAREGGSQSSGQLALVEVRSRDSQPRRDLFDYAALPEEIAPRLEELTSRVKGHLRTAYVEIGRDLLKAKELLEHGQFGRWLDLEFGMSARHAQNHMNAARLADDKPELISHLGPTVSFKLAAPSTPEAVREEILARAQRGELVTVEAVTQTIREARLKGEPQRRRFRHQPPPPKPVSPQTLARREKQRQREQEERRLAEQRRAACAEAAAHLLIDRLGADVRRLKALVDHGSWFKVRAHLPGSELIYEDVEP